MGGGCAGGGCAGGGGGEFGFQFAEIVACGGNCGGGGGNEGFVTCG